MEAILKDINAVVGVIGSFVCLPDETIAAQAMPARYTHEQLELAARVAMQAFQALDAAGQPIADADLLFGGGRVIFKNLCSGVLVIFCARNINLPLLNLASNTATKKLNIKLAAPTSTIPAASQTPTPAGVIEPAAPQAPARTVAPAETPVIPSASSEIAPNPLFIELEKEAQRLTDTAKANRVALITMDPLAMWACCKETRRFIAMPQNRHIAFLGRSEQSAQIIQLFQRMGYQPHQRFNSVYGNRRLHFAELTLSTGIDVYLDAFEMYHRLDLKSILAQNINQLPITPLTLIRLQLVEIMDADLRELCAVFLEHNLTLTNEKDKVDSLQIARICAEDWGWYKTVTMNLQAVLEHIEEALVPAQRDIVSQRVLRLKSNIQATPKSLRWQTRARLGETIRWYETPLRVDGAGPRTEFSLA